MPNSLALLGLGVGVVQADQARKELVKAARKELVKYLPEVAQEQWQPIYDAIKECFDMYEQEVTERMDDDIKARKAELDNLIKQKESHEINREQELARLKQLEADVASQAQKVETAYHNFVNAI
ncbi:MULTISPECIES: hypothetical protein [Moorena]|uniref:BDLP-like helical domain-containing protein n=1 Tax=Moorena producens 3L TaxID=489825 RepID=F4Y409_9CYAN|nr:MULTISPECIES: hypothetical protein [Moorena]EGJ28505.1 hypothetical protein LYNGBM3L_74230 [Moorena producens 3L]OLT65869.1 hypothetical protein BI334_13250 [Moorena producens 3L]